MLIGSFLRHVYIMVMDFSFGRTYINCLTSRPLLHYWIDCTAIPTWTEPLNCHSYINWSLSAAFREWLVDISGILRFLVRWDADTFFWIDDERVEMSRVPSIEIDWGAGFAPAANRGQGRNAVANCNRGGEIRFRCFVTWRLRCSKFSESQRSMQARWMWLSNRPAIQIPQFEREISVQDEHTIILQWMRSI
jgi:hypothetical protein